MNGKSATIKNKLQLYFIMGSNNCLKDPVSVLQDAINGGITCFQFREKGNGAKVGQEKVELAKELQSICKRNSIPFIVNDDLPLALEINADGIHIGQEDEDPVLVRKEMAGKIVGISAHNLQEAQAAVAVGADYIGVGPMYETKTKTDTRKVQGPDIITQLRKHHITIPIVGIGGIQQKVVKTVINAGADGIAVISAISQSQDPQLAAKQLLSAIH